MFLSVFFFCFFSFLFFLFFFIFFFFFSSAVLVSGRKLLNALTDCLEIFRKHRKYFAIVRYCFSAFSEIQDGRQMPFSWKIGILVVYWSSSAFPDDNS